MERIAFGRERSSVTLMELLIAIVLLAVVILGVNNIDIFSRSQFISTDRRAKLQNDVSHCLEHIAKNASRAIGNEALDGADTAVYITNRKLIFFTDINADGLKSPEPEDYWTGYSLVTTTHRFRYCWKCNDYICGSCISGFLEPLASNITAFTAAKDFSKGNYLNVTLTACWDPDQITAACDTPDNPSVTMSTSINLPSVSTN